MSDEITSLELGTFTLMSYRIHPSVPLQMLEFFYRKTGPQMVGALLGRIESTHVDITNCFAIPFVHPDEDEEEEEPEFTNELDEDYFRKMSDLNSKISPKECLVGWFTDVLEINMDVVELHAFFYNKFREERDVKGKSLHFNTPLVVLVDPLSEKSIFGLRAYTNPSLQIPQLKEFFGAFQEVSLNFQFGHEAKNEVAPLWLEKTELKDKERQNPFGLINLDTMEDQMKETLENIQKLENYVKDVNAGKEKPDIEIGKTIKNILNLAPSIEQSSFKELLDKYMQDILMVMYLSNLANSQVLVSEKLSKIA